VLTGPHNGRRLDRRRLYATAARVAGCAAGAIGGRSAADAFASDAISARAVGRGAACAAVEEAKARHVVGRKRELRVPLVERVHRRLRSVASACGSSYAIDFAVVQAAEHMAELMHEHGVDVLRIGHPIHRRTLPEPRGEVNVDVATAARTAFC